MNYFVNNSVERIIYSIFFTGKFDFKYNAILKFSEEYFEVIDQTRGRVFPPSSKHREVGWKNEAQPRV